MGHRYIYIVQRAMLWVSLPVFPLFYSVSSGSSADLQNVILIWSISTLKHKLSFFFFHFFLSHSHSEKKSQYECVIKVVCQFVSFQRNSCLGFFHTHTHKMLHPQCEHISVNDGYHYRPVKPTHQTHQHCNYYWHKKAIICICEKYSVSKHT